MTAIAPHNYRWNFDNIWGHFFWHGLTLFPAWISIHLSGKVLDEITYPFLNFNGHTVFNGCTVKV